MTPRDRDLVELSNKLIVLERNLRANFSLPDDREAGSVWSWRVDEWADHVSDINRELLSLLQRSPAEPETTDEETRVEPPK